MFKKTTAEQRKKKTKNKKPQHAKQKWFRRHAKFSKLLLE